MTHLVCKMLAFTIQFPNNNPAPPTPSTPHTSPQGTSQDAVPADTGQTPKHQAPNPPHPTKGDRRPGGLLPQNPTVHQTLPIASPDPCALPTPPTPQEGRRCVLNHTHHTTQTMPTPEPPNTTTRLHSGNPFPGVEFIDIPPLSNPPAPHSGTDMGNQKLVSSLERR